MTPSSCKQVDLIANKFGRQLVDWYRTNQRPLPWRVLFQKSNDAYAVWVSEIMLQQTVLATVVPRYHAFMERFPTVQSLASATEQQWIPYVQGLGYYRRFRLMHRAMQQLASDLANGKTQPQTYDEWRELPGIGPYTAAAISSIAYNYPAVVVDGNVERVVCRIMDWRIPPNARESKVRITEVAERLLVKTAASDFNQGIMELGQLICTPTNPSCDQCPVASTCMANAEASQHLAPAAKLKADKKKVQLHIQVPMQKSGKIGISLRDSQSPFLKGSVGFPLSIGRKRTDQPTIVGSFKHNITNHEISAYVTCFRPNKLSAYKWYSRDEIRPYLLASLDLKALKILNKKKAP